MTQPRDLQHEFFDMLMESQFWLSETLLAYQRQQLAQLLRHARGNVPFYEKRLDAAFTPSGDIDWSRWHEVPIVTRADMIDHRDSMLARAVPKGHGQSSTIASSGSTGLPIQITTNRLTVLAADANRWRAHRWHGLDWKKTYTAREGLDPRADRPSGQALGPWGPHWEQSAQEGQAFCLSYNTTVAQMVEYISSNRSSYFSGGPKTAHAMAIEAERRGIEIKLDCVLTQGEHLGREDVAIIKRVFGARTLEHYSSKEGGQIAYPCPSGHGFHVNAESVFVEIVDAEGRPCVPGQPGRVVITPFVSTAQPLIRYDQGDIARSGPACSCGRGLPVLEAIEGRTVALFTHPDGRAIARHLTDDARQALACTFWQIAQVGPTRFEVRYVPRDWNISADETTATAVFRHVYFADADVTFVRSKAIALTAAGKHIEYINEWSTRT